MREINILDVPQVICIGLRKQTQSYFRLISEIERKSLQAYECEQLSGVMKICNLVPWSYICIFLLQTLHMTSDTQLSDSFGFLLDLDWLDWLGCSVVYILRH